MTTAVSYQPLALAFRGVLPNTFGPDVSTFGSDVPSSAGGITFVAAPVAARVSAAIIGDDQHFQVRDLYVLEWVDEIVPPGPPPGEGPPHARSGPIAPALRKTRVLEVARAVEGAGSIDVDVGQVLLVRVQYAALGVEGNYAATLSIAADKWDPVAVPLSMFLAEVTTAASDVLNIAQGSTADLAVELRSVMGPAVDVTYARHCQVVGLVGEGGHVRALPALGHRIKPSRIYAEIALELGAAVTSDHEANRPAINVR